MNNNNNNNDSNNNDNTNNDNAQQGDPLGPLYFVSFSKTYCSHSRVN